MSRNLDPTFAETLNAGIVMPAILVMLTFKSSTAYCWSGIGTLVWDAQSFLGVGSLGKLGAITEGIDVKADGTTLTLSGIDPVFKASALTDIKLGAPAKVWYGHMLNGVLIGAPYLIFSGQVDKPSFSIGGDTVSITLALENKLINHARASNRRYTSADQRIAYPTDTGFAGVEALSDQALMWG